jgi:glutamate N-acetyltransferase/amino-acid N-acetyltransferase
MIDGIEFSGVASGLKPSGLDLGLVFFREEMNLLSAYTRNRVKAAHILYDRRLREDGVRALLANSGCANACTGSPGIADLTAIVDPLSRLLGVPPESIFFASTGVIGRRLPLDHILGALPASVKALKTSHVDSFARAIMTTDTHHKIVLESFQGEKPYSIVGIAKGSGMINPLFATMLAFVFTDYPVSRSQVQRAFKQSVKESFERITVDGECSTNDTVMLFTRKGVADGTSLGIFKEKLRSVLKELSMMVVRDGEGATKVVHITVKGAKTKSTAELMARRISISPLCKTAFFGCDPNWGRIIAAIGDAGSPVNVSKVEISFQGQVLAKEGLEVPFSEEAVKQLMNKKDVEVVVDLHDGRASYDIHTTDLTYEYIKINASYRT